MNDHVVHFGLSLLLKPGQGLGVGVAHVSEDGKSRLPLGPFRKGLEPKEIRPTVISSDMINY